MAAWQFPMGANSEIYLPDANQDIIWWIRTDNVGNRTVQGFDVKPHVKPVQVDTQDLAARLAAVEEWINAKSNKSNAKRNSNSAAATVSVAAE
jgi:succinate dehydrogenase/fumarate reductase-like Fe-S protein